MQHSNQVGAPESQGPAPIGNRDYMAFFSSAAISFAAMMAMLKAEQDGMNSMAQLAMTTTQDRLTSILNTATATQNMYNDDAAVLTQQSNEQIASAVSSFGQAGCGVGGLVKTAQAASFSNKMGALNAETNQVTLNSAAAAEFGPGVPGAARSITQSTADSIRSQLMGAGAGAGNGDGISQAHYARIIGEGGINNFDLRRLTNSNITENGTADAVTLKQVLETAPNQEDLDSLKAGIGKGKANADEQFKRVNDKIQMQVQIGNALAQAGSGTATSLFKAEEASLTKEKGQAAMQQSLSQSNLQFAQETQKSQSDQSQQFNSLSGQVWQSINQLVQVDTRG